MSAPPGTKQKLASSDGLLGQGWQATLGLATHPSTSPTHGDRKRDGDGILRGAGRLVANVVHDGGRRHVEPDVADRGRSYD